MVSTQLRRPHRLLPTPQAAEDIFQSWLRIPDESYPIEIIDGEITVSPGTSKHALALSRLNFELRFFIQNHELGEVYSAPLSLIIRPDFVAEPDIIFVHADRLGIVQEKTLEEPPDLVVEVISPTTEHRDRGVKLVAYGSFGIREVWLVDPVARTIEVYALTGKDLFLWKSFPAEEVATSQVLVGLELDCRRLWK